MNEQQGPPWARAGGYTREDWVKCLRLALKRHVGAANARSQYMEQLREISPATLGEIAGLKAADEEATRVWRGVLSGDAAVVSPLIDEIWAEDERRNPTENRPD